MRPKPKPKRPGGAAQLRALGKIPIQVTLTAEQLELIDRARTKDGRSRAGFFAHYTMEAANKLLKEN